MVLLAWPLVFWVGFLVCQFYWCFPVFFSLSSRFLFVYPLYTFGSLALFVQYISLTDKKKYIKFSMKSLQVLVNMRVEREDTP